MRKQLTNITSTQKSRVVRTDTRFPECHWTTENKPKRERQNTSVVSLSVVMKLHLFVGDFGVRDYRNKLVFRESLLKETQYLQLSRTFVQRRKVGKTGQTQDLLCKLMRMGRTKDWKRVTLGKLYLFYRSYGFSFITQIFHRQFILHQRTGRYPSLFRVEGRHVRRNSFLNDCGKSEERYPRIKKKEVGVVKILGVVVSFFSSSFFQFTLYVNI